MPGDDVSKILVSEDDIKVRVNELAREISENYKNESFVLVGVLKGAFIFLSDLVKSIKSRCSIDFIVTSSYGLTGTSFSGKVKLLKDISQPIKGKNVIVVDDILDTGSTLNFVLEHLSNYEPKSLEICTLLSKPDRRKINIDAKYVGFTIPDEFVVGYGLGYNEEYRNLPYVGVLKEEVWKARA